MTLKQTNKCYKCLNCKKFGMKPLLKIYKSASDIMYERGQECIGHSEYTGIQGAQGSGVFIIINFYRCDNCYAEYMEDDQLKLKKKFSNNKIWIPELEKLKQEALREMTERLLEEQE